MYKTARLYKVHWENQKLTSLDCTLKYNENDEKHSHFTVV